MKRIGNDEGIHVSRVFMAGLPAFLITLFAVGLFLSLFPLREAFIFLASVIVLGLLGGTLLIFFRRKRARSVLGIPDPQAAEAPLPTRPK